MKHIKLFEQFEDEEESWWDEESPFDKFEPRLQIISHGSTFYIAQKISSSEQVKLFEDLEGEYNIVSFQLSPKIYDNTIITIFDRNDKYGVDYKGNRGVSWKYFKFKDLPKEIKDRL